MDNSYGCPGNAAIVEKGPQEAQWGSETTLAFMGISMFKAVISGRGAWTSPEW